jgi:hypothetical protein
MERFIIGLEQIKNTLESENLQLKSERESLLASSEEVRQLQEKLKELE